MFARCWNENSLIPFCKQHQPKQTSNSIQSQCDRYQKRFNEHASRQQRRLHQTFSCKLRGYMGILWNIVFLIDRHKSTSLILQGGTLNKQAAQVPTKSSQKLTKWQRPKLRCSNLRAMVVLSWSICTEWPSNLFKAIDFCQNYPSCTGSLWGELVKFWSCAGNQCCDPQQLLHGKNLEKSSLAFREWPRTICLTAYSELKEEWDRNGSCSGQLETTTRHNRSSVVELKLFKWYIKTCGPPHRSLLHLPCSKGLKQQWKQRTKTRPLRSKTSTQIWWSNCPKSSNIAASPHLHHAGQTSRAEIPSLMPQHMASILEVVKHPWMGLKWFEQWCYCLLVTQAKWTQSCSTVNLLWNA